MELRVERVRAALDTYFKKFSVSDLMIDFNSLERNVFYAACRADDVVIDVTTRLIQFQLATVTYVKPQREGLANIFRPNFVCQGLYTKRV